MDQAGLDQKKTIHVQTGPDWIRST